MQSIPPPSYSLFSPWPRISGQPFGEDVSEILNGALSVVVNILGPRDASEQTLYLENNGGQDRKNKFKAHKVLFNYGSHHSRDTDAIGFGLRWIIGVASFMLGNLSAPLASQDLSMRRFAVAESGRIDKDLEHCKRYGEHPIAVNLVELLKQERQIFSIVKRNAEITLGFRIGLVATAALSFIGAIFALPDILLFGSIGMFGFTCAMLLKAGSDSTAFLIRHKASEMRRYLDYFHSVSWWWKGATIGAPISHSIPS